MTAKVDTVTSQEVVILKPEVALIAPEWRSFWEIVIFFLGKSRILAKKPC